MMGTVSRGFRGRRRPSAELPSGQYLVEDFPVLSAGPTPTIELEDWEFTITNETGDQQRWDWTSFRALPSEEVTVDLHCVTHWSKLATSWEGVSLDTLLADVETSASFALVSSYGGYTTNLPLEDLTAKPGSRSATTAKTWRPSSAARPGCWSPTCTCGRAPSGSAESGSLTRTSPASGKASATTTTATPGASSGSGATEDGGSDDQLGAVERRQRARRPPP
jgi:hypothetical protein